MNLDEVSVRILIGVLLLFFGRFIRNLIWSLIVSVYFLRIKK